MGIPGILLGASIDIQKVLYSVLFIILVDRLMQ